MRLKIFMLCLVALFVSQTSRAQWVVTDPGNLAQGIINATKNIVHTSSTASTMIQNFQETVKIYKVSIRFTTYFLEVFENIWDKIWRN